MGQLEHDKADAKNKRRLKVRRSQARAKVQPTAINPEALAAFAVAVLMHEGAVMIGTTRDGGAFVISVYMDDDVQKAYVGADEDVNEVLQGLVDDLI